MRTHIAEDKKAKNDFLNQSNARILRIYLEKYLVLSTVTSTE